MKRIYITGAALFLLAIIASDYYINSSRKYDNKLEAVAPSSVQELPTPAVATLPDPTLEQLALNAPPPNISGIFPHRHNRAGKDMKKIKTDGVADVATNNEGVGFNVSSPDNQIGAEKSKDYFGARPVRYSYITFPKPHHNKRFELPKGLGIELGYNQSSFTDNQTSNLPISNFNIGLLYNFELGNHFAFQPGLRYVTKGNRLMSDLDVETQEKLSLHYLEVPANLVVKFGKVGNARIMAGAGPYVSYLAGARERYQTPGLGEGNDAMPLPAVYATNKVNKFDWGMGGFLGVQSPDGFFFKAGAEIGMMDINTKTDGSTADRNYNMMISAGYIIGGK